MLLLMEQSQIHNSCCFLMAIHIKDCFTSKIESLEEQRVERLHPGLGEFVI